MEPIIELNNEVPEVQTQQSEQMILRRSTKEKRSVVSDDYIMFLQDHQDDIGIMEDDPINFQQALKSYSSQKWINTVEEKIKFMKDNDVWELVELSSRVKPIGCK